MIFKNISHFSTVRCKLLNSLENYLHYMAILVILNYRVLTSGLHLLSIFLSIYYYCTLRQDYAIVYCALSEVYRLFLRLVV